MSSITSLLGKAGADSLSRYESYKTQRTLYRLTGKPFAFGGYRTLFFIFASKSLKSPELAGHRIQPIDILTLVS